MKLLILFIILISVGYSQQIVTLTTPKGQLVVQLDDSLFIDTSVTPPKLKVRPVTKDVLRVYNMKSTQNYFDLVDPSGGVVDTSTVEFMRNGLTLTNSIDYTIKGTVLTCIVSSCTVVASDVIRIKFKASIKYPLSKSL